MSIRSILVPLLPQDEPSPMLNAALQIERRFEGHLDALLIQPDVTEAVAMLLHRGGQPAAIEDVEAAHRLAATRSRARFDDWSEATMPIGEAAHAAALRTTNRWSEETAPIEQVLPAYGRLSDLIVLHYPTRHIPDSDRMFTVATSMTGRPILLVRHEIPNDILWHVMVAWDGGLPATRALAGAMPLLAAAGMVTIFTATPPDGVPMIGPSLSKALARHGIHSQQTWAHRSDATVGDAMLRAASERGVSLIVKGARHHSPHLPPKFCGVTRHVLHEGSVPVLMAR